MEGKNHGFSKYFTSIRADCHCIIHWPVVDQQAQVCQTNDLTEVDLHCWHTPQVDQVYRLQVDSEELQEDEKERNCLPQVLVSITLHHFSAVKELLSFLSNRRFFTNSHNFSSWSAFTLTSFKLLVILEYVNVIAQCFPVLLEVIVLFHLLYHLVYLLISRCRRFDDEIVGVNFLVGQDSFRLGDLYKLRLRTVVEFSITANLVVADFVFQLYVFSLHLFKARIGP